MHHELEPMFEFAEGMVIEGGLDSLMVGRASLPKQKGTECRTNESVDTSDGPANLGREAYEMRLAVFFPLISNHPLKALMAIINVRLCRS